LDTLALYTSNRISGDARGVVSAPTASPLLDRLAGWSRPYEDPPPPPGPWAAWRGAAVSVAAPERSPGPLAIIDRAYQPSATNPRHRCLRFVIASDGVCRRPAMMVVSINGGAHEQHASG